MPLRSIHEEVRTPHAARQRRTIAALGLCIAVLVPPLLSGCAAMVVGGASAGAAALYDRRPYYVVIDDQDIEIRSIAALQQDPLVKGHSGISVTSYNYSVLLTGQAESPEVEQRAVSLVRNQAKVKRVIDEITIGPRIGFSRESEDAYLTSRVKLSLLQVKLQKFDPTRVKVVTEDAVVYLMGLLTPEEANAVTEQVRYVPGVQRVVKLFEYRPTNS